MLALLDLTIDLLNEFEGESDSIYLEMSPNYHFPSRVITRFTGEFQPISSEKLFLIEGWLKTFLPDMSESDIKDLFFFEMLVREDGAEYWVPMQSMLLPDMMDHLEVDNEIGLYILWMGAFVEEDGFDRIFLITAWDDGLPAGQ